MPLDSKTLPWLAIPATQPRASTQGHPDTHHTVITEGTSSAQAIAAEDSMKQQSPVILQAVCQPDRTLQQQFKEGVSTLGNKSPKKLGKRGISESSAEHDVDTHEIAKVQRLEQLQRVTPEAFYEPGSVLKLEANEEEKVLATSEDEQHLRDFGEPSSSQTTAADDRLEQRPLAIPKAVVQLHPTPLSQHIEEGSVSEESENAEKLGKRRYSESSAGHEAKIAMKTDTFSEQEAVVKSDSQVAAMHLVHDNQTDTSGTAKMLRSEEQLPLLLSDIFYEPHFSMHKSKSNEEKKALATPGNSTSGGFGGEGDGTPSCAQQSVLDQGTSITGIVPVAGGDIVLPVKQKDPNWMIRTKKAIVKQEDTDWMIRKEKAIVS
ncbi:hypothetical protein P5673_015944 [Acropora cervicornis]|uniref:Uncharacterized protein n=1 Tax=Acropora cervicornis TaxID=6130 RepID=A0AAD9V528_ACRCE|nr:hypothetical protein P5673_015944 [Acropora cervicornis]